MCVINNVNKILASLSWSLNRARWAHKISAERRSMPDSFVRVHDNVVNEHRHLFGPLIGDVNCSWLEHYCRMSRCEDARFVPEDVFFMVIERCLNREKNGSKMEDKNGYSAFVPEQNLPRAILRYDYGNWFDGKFRPITRNEARDCLHAVNEDVVGKPAIDSCGGNGVHCFKKVGNVFVHDNQTLELDFVENNYDAYIIQERLVQNKETAAFNPDSINTCRMMTFRRPWSGKTSLIAAMHRFGCGGGVADNLAVGGVCVDVDMNGYLGAEAIGHTIGLVTEHPRTKKKFEGFRLPHFDRMKALVEDVASRYVGCNLLSFDVIAKEDGTPCVIEVNTMTQGIEQLQMRRPLFGDETEMVVDWCLKHKLRMKYRPLSFST